MIKIFLAFLLSVLTLIPAHGFSDLGHKMVAAIAWQQLTPFAKQKVQRILGAGEQQFVKASVWADHIKSNDSFNYLKPMHYVNMPKDAQRYNRQRDCRKNKCVVQAIETFSQVLTSNKEKNKKLALRMVIHLLGIFISPYMRACVKTVVAIGTRLITRARMCRYTSFGITTWLNV